MNKCFKQKRHISLLLVLSLLLASSFSFATAPFYVNGNLVAFEKAQPFIDENGRTQVPLRKVLEVYGARVSWNLASKEATAAKDGIEVRVPLGQKYLYRNNVVIPMDTSAKVIEGSTYLPIRAVVEALGGTVGWNTSTNSIEISETIGNDGSVNPPQNSDIFVALHVDTSTPSYLKLLKEQSLAWGLGSKIEAYVTNDRPYSWYIDQGDTGTHSSNNCGPSTVTMAARWFDKATSASAQKARLNNRPLGGWWYSGDIDDSLTRFNVGYSKTTLKDTTTMTSLLKAGHIIIVNNSMDGIPLNEDATKRTNRFYSFDSGHYFIVKGFVQVDQKIYFEVYDPNSWNMRYSDGYLMGQNRYYEGTALVRSILDWYPTLVVIDK